MRSTPIKLAVLTLISLVSTGCAVDPRTGQPSLKETFASEDPCSNNARNLGLLIGAVAGGILGNQFNHSNASRLGGAAIGATIGGLIGNDIDQRRCELHKIAKANNLDIAMVDIKPSDVGMSNTGNTPTQSKSDSVGMQVSIKDNNRQFESGSDVLTVEAANYFHQIAEQYSFTKQQQAIGAKPTPDQLAVLNTLRNRRVLLVGHTDDTGSSRLNADLSERRAKAVARIFKEQGILEDNIFFQGAGETLPIADNRTDEGRARNRRVEIIDLADEQAFRAFLARRSANVAFYRNTSTQIATNSKDTTESTPHKAAASKKARSPAASLEKTTVSEAPLPSKANEATASKERDKSSTSVAAAPPSTKPAAVSKISSEQFVDFGGTTDLSHAGIDIGKVFAPSGGFTLISAAHADVPVTSACINDRPRVAHGVKSLKTGKDYETAEYMPGLYQTSWTDQVNGHLMAMTNVAVLRDGGVPANRPTLLIYRDYKPDAKPTYSGNPEVNVYRGDKAVLYRVFADGPVKCIDMVIPNAAPNSAPGSHLFYSKSASTYVAGWNPRIAR